ncbi:MAG: peptidoglycan DD-metalloendopeptidase family protein [Dethiobacteria bacterium]|jgi:murein DD-endopeptidase MepM/ murein hydrolase activator NlpD|nr:M23 family metallopeptidase [Bacillota bacterium]
MEPENSTPGAKFKSWSWLLFMFAASLVLTGTFAVQKYNDSFLYSVAVEGEEVGLVREAELVEEYLQEITEETRQKLGMDVVVMEDVVLELEYRPWEEETPAKVKEELQKRLTFKTKGYMVTLNEEPIMPVATEEDVQSVVDAIEKAYTEVKAENVRLVDVSIQEKIGWKEVLVAPEEIQTPDYVSEILLRGTDKRENYLVSRGDTLWDIARKHELTVEELRRANPQLDGELIQPGDELELIVAEPKVNVTTVEEVTVTEKIPFETTYTNDSSMWRNQTKIVTPGEHGKKEATYRVTRVNNKEVKREKIEEKIIKEPKEQVVARGTGSIPSRGTGKFCWPVSGGGIITQYFHGRHRGLDISASGSIVQKKNTPILAADDGIVVHAGYEGSYGLTVVIYHGGAQKYYTRYAHNSRNLVSAGDEVKKGQIIGYMGNSGYTRGATGVHLHFEIRRGSKYGTPLNPLDFFRP